MSDLISRQWLMECIDEGWIKFDTEKDANMYIHLIRDIAPSAQPEQPEIIRCKDCKYRDDDDFCIGRGYPNSLVPDDGFCDKGERSE